MPSITKGVRFMFVELSDTDIAFIYGHFLKELSKINRIASAPDCPFDKSTITNQKNPFESVVEKLRVQYPNLEKLDDHF